MEGVRPEAILAASRIVSDRIIIGGLLRIVLQIGALQWLSKLKALPSTLFNCMCLFRWRYW